MSPMALSRGISTYEEAIAFLDTRIGQGIKPGLERIEALLDLMANPHHSYRVIHIAGTNGKTTVTRMVAALLESHGLRVGTFTSPHLIAIEERFSITGAALTAEEFVEAVADVAPFVDIYEAQSGERVTFFELTVAIALQAFASTGVEVAVVEVGLGGRLDATNVVDADVSVITGISFDHTEYLGETIFEIATEKAGILKEKGTLVSGPLPSSADGAMTARVAEIDSRWVRFGEDFRPESVSQAVGGWQADYCGVYGEYAEVFIPLHGRHQVDHFLTALASCEMLFDRALDPESVSAGAASLTAPGRIQVMNRNPLLIVDGAHNVEGMEGLAAALVGEFPPVLWTLVIGVRGERDVADLLEPMVGLVSEVIATTPTDDAAIPAEVIAAVAAEVFGADVPIQTVVPVARAITESFHTVDEEGAIVVAGSLYVAGEAIARLNPTI